VPNRFRDPDDAHRLPRLVRPYVKGAGSRARRDQADGAEPEPEL